MQMPYRTTDKVIDYLNKQYLKLFRRAKGISNFDELNVISLSHEIYERAIAVTQTEMVRLADTIYKRYRTASEESELGIAWVLALMAAYNPVTKYIYDNEAERKRSRFAESVIASETPQEDVDRSLRVWVAQNKQLAEDVTFDAMVQAYTDDGVENVEWVTHPDDRRCAECKSRHGNVYPIGEIPPKPHMRCRCYVRPARGGK